MARRFPHYFILAGAHGGAAWRARGEQFGRYEAAIGTGQANFWFARDQFPEKSST